MSKYINVEVNTDVDVYIGDVWEQIDDDELRGEVIRRKLSARVNLGATTVENYKPGEFRPHPVRCPFAGLSSVR